MKITWHHERRKITSIKVHPNNPRIATEEQMNHLRKSIDEFGIAEPLCINMDGQLIGGHARLKILIEKKEKETDVWVPDRQLTDDEVKELLIRLNKNQMSFDWDILASDFEPSFLERAGFDLEELEKHGLVEPGGDTAAGESESKPIKVTITFTDMGHYEKAQEEITALVERYDAMMSMGGGAL